MVLPTRGNQCEKKERQLRAGREKNTERLGRPLRQAASERKSLGGIQKKPRTAGGRRRLIRVRVPEGRRFFVALLRGTTRMLLARVLRWSNWRRPHQTLVTFFHYKTLHALAFLQL